MKQFSREISLLVSYCVHDNVWGLWFLITEFSLAAMLDPSLKSLLCESVAGLVELQIWSL